MVAVANAASGLRRRRGPVELVFMIAFIGSEFREMHEGPRGDGCCLRGISLRGLAQWNNGTCERDGEPPKRSNLALVSDNRKEVYFGVRTADVKAVLRGSESSKSLSSLSGPSSGTRAVS
jgi:hypothetical protein